MIPETHPAVQTTQGCDANPRLSLERRFLKPSTDNLINDYGERG